jgi:Response regulator receiver domain
MARWGITKRYSKDADTKYSPRLLPDKDCRLLRFARSLRVIVDYHMPEMNGHEVATEIKRLTPQVPIVMVSGDDEIPEQALNGVDAFVSKNETPNRLLPVINQICGNPSQGTGKPESRPELEQGPCPRLGSNGFSPLCFPAFLGLCAILSRTREQALIQLDEHGH